MNPKITLLYSGIFALLYFVLSVRVIRFRWKEKKGLGHDHDPKSGLFRAVRVHGNFFEFIPFLMFLMFLDEITGRSSTLLHAAGVALVTGRILHAWGITKSHVVSWQRSVGVATTYLCLILFGVSLILKGVS